MCVFSPSYIDCVRGYKSLKDLSDFLFFMGNEMKGSKCLLAIDCLTALIRRFGVDEIGNLIGSISGEFIIGWMIVIATNIWSRNVSSSNVFQTRLFEGIRNKEIRIDCINSSDSEEKRKWKRAIMQYNNNEKRWKFEREGKIILNSGLKHLKWSPSKYFVEVYRFDSCENSFG